MKLFIVILLYSMLFAGAEMAHRYFNVRPETTRRGVHFLSATFAGLLVFWLSKPQILGLTFAFLAFLILSRFTSLLKSIHNVKRGGLGELLFPVGVILAALLLLPRNQLFYLMALLILAISDPLASWLGSRAKKQIHASISKTWVGSGVFFVSSFVLASCFVAFLPALVIAAVTTGVEMVSGYGTDNVFIIISIYLTLWLMRLV